jgi:glycerol-3-phosphate dehydrogenase
VLLLLLLLLLSLTRLQFEGRKLTEIINEDHENKKYLPGVQLPENVKAVADIEETIKGATALVFVMPHQCEFCFTSH